MSICLWIQWFTSSTDGFLYAIPEASFNFMQRKWNQVIVICLSYTECSHIIHWSTANTHLTMNECVSVCLMEIAMPNQCHQTRTSSKWCRHCWWMRFVHQGFREVANRVVDLDQHFRQRSAILSIGGNDVWWWWLCDSCLFPCPSPSPHSEISTWSWAGQFQRSHTPSGCTKIVPVLDLVRCIYQVLWEEKMWYVMSNVFNELCHW